MSCPIRSVLVATDFSPGAALAARRAARLAGSLGAALHLVHVVDARALEELRALVPEAAQGREQVVEEARRAMSETSSGLGVPCEARVEVGNLPGALVEAAQQHDMLVLGAQGATTVRSAVMGSTVERLLLRVERPILVVKREAAGPYAQVVIPCEYAPPARRALELALHVAPEGQITLVHALELDFEGRLWRMALPPEQVAELRASGAARARAWLEGLSRDLPNAGRVRPLVVHGPARRLVPEISGGADLVVMGKQGRSSAGEAFLGSLTRRMLADAGCDVLVVPPGRGPG